MYILNRAINFNISMLSWSLLVFRCALWIFNIFICATCSKFRFYFICFHCESGPTIFQPDDLILIRVSVARAFLHNAIRFLGPGCTFFSPPFDIFSFIPLAHSSPFTPSHSHSVSFFFVLLASIWMQPASALRNLYNFTYINRVWWSGVKNKNEKPEFSVRCNFSWFRIRISPYLCVYLFIHVAALCTEYWTVIHVCQMLLLCTHKPADI